MVTVMTDEEISNFIKQIEPDGQVSTAPKATDETAMAD